MLVLTVYKDEPLYIVTKDGERIELIVDRINNSKVKVAVNAPASIKIYRKKLYDAMRAAELIQATNLENKSLERNEHGFDIPTSEG